MMFALVKMIISELVSINLKSFSDLSVNEVYLK